MTAETGQELERAGGGELVNKRLEAGLAEGNGVIDPARWQMLAAIAETVYQTAFVPVGLRDSKPSTLACLLYGDALGLQPMTSLKEIHVIDGMPGLSAAAMAALVRKAHPGHRLGRTEIRDADGRFLGVTIRGVRGDTEETDEYTFTLEMASRAGLMSKHNWQKYPEAMCTARASSQICTFLFPDVFMGSPLMPEELEGLGVDEPAGNLETGSPIVPTPKPEPLRTDTCPIHGIERKELEVARGRFYCPECKLAGAEGEPPLPDADAIADAVNDAATVDGAPVVVPGGEQPVEQTEWEVANADTGESVTYIDADDRGVIAASDSKLIRFPDVEGKWEIVGYEVDGASGKEKLLVRPEPVAAGKPAAGSPDAVVKENIPEILGKWVAQAQEAGNIEFVRGVLNAEREGKNRGRLVGTLEEIVATMEADALKKTLDGDGTGADNPLLDPEEVAQGSQEPQDGDELLEGEHEEPESESAEDAPLVAEEGSFQPFEPEPEPAPEPVAELDEDAARAGDLEIPYTSLSKTAKIVRLSALCALVEDQFPTQRAWHLSGVIGAGSRQWGITAHALDDFEDEQLELIWKAAEQHVPDAVKFLALAQPADVAKMGGAA